jgi:hypothetical protein
MRLPVTKASKKEYVNELRPRYLNALREEQSMMLDEIIKVCRFNRKYLIRLLHKRPPSRRTLMKTTTKVGRPNIYSAPEILTFLVSFWHATNQACGKRLKSVLPLWLRWYAPVSRVPLSLLHQALLVRVSPATIDRLLADERQKYRVGKGRSTTKPGTLLKKRIAIKTDQWEERRPGFLEVDTVAHCGTSTAGQFVYSLNSVDIATSWTEARAVWGKGERGVVDAFESIEQALPFRLRGFDSDNGSEFINYHMEKYLMGRKRRPERTRSREYRKNDNAHIEEKNWTHIRQYFGYERFNNPDVVPLMNQLYANEYSLLLNFFLPSVKLQNKVRIGSQIKKQHDAPKTPCQRVLMTRLLPREIKQRLLDLQQSLNPYELHKSVQRQIKTILRMCTLRQNHNHQQRQAEREVTPLALRARSVTSRSTSRSNNTSHERSLDRT